MEVSRFLTLTLLPQIKCMDRKGTKKQVQIEAKDLQLAQISNHSMINAALKRSISHNLRAIIEASLKMKANSMGIKMSRREILTRFALIPNIVVWMMGQMMKQMKASMKSINSYLPKKLISERPLLNKKVST